jgi:negative regulator of genetic competence, sporulation and motility
MTTTFTPRLPQKPNIRFKDVNVGECFKYEDKFYMRVDSLNHAVQICNAQNKVGQLRNLAYDNNVEAVHISMREV